MKRQHGGTFLGLIVGIVIGLGVALAVAVYVTKVPVPFVNKGQTRSTEQDATEAKKNKDWNPNAPLYGKNAVKPAAPGSAPAAPASVAAVEPAPASVKAVPPVVSPEAKAPGKAEARTSASSDPLGDLAKARSTVNPVDPFSYFVQVGAYRSAEDAESQRAKLSLAGIETRVSEREQSGRAVFRVRAGPMDKREEAEKIKEKVEGLGMEAALVRVQR